MELISALARPQHEHRERTADRLAAITATGLLPADLHEMGVYYGLSGGVINGAELGPVRGCGPGGHPVKVRRAVMLPAGAAQPGGWPSEGTLHQR
ncbi:hypothetical protein ACFYW1_04430 [Streptomyces sp. NPDC002669]|uniref:hypothetical protein n=1 Tax=Streptomyces sp. NPDC002669 TaxID=3364658 RepID=UPI0036A0F1D2